MSNNIFEQFFAQYKEQKTKEAISKARNLTDRDISQPNIAGILDKIADAYCFEVAYLDASAPKVTSHTETRSSRDYGRDGTIEVAFARAEFTYRASGESFTYSPSRCKQISVPVVVRGNILSATFYDDEFWIATLTSLSELSDKILISFGKICRHFVANCATHLKKSIKIAFPREKSSTSAMRGGSTRSIIRPKARPPSAASGDGSGSVIQIFSAATAQRSRALITSERLSFNFAAIVSISASSVTVIRRLILVIQTISVTVKPAVRVSGFPRRRTRRLELRLLRPHAADFRVEHIDVGGRCLRLPYHRRDRRAVRGEKTQIRYFQKLQPMIVDVPVERYCSLFVLINKRPMTKRYEITHVPGEASLRLIFPEGAWESLPFEIRLLRPWQGSEFCDRTSLTAQQHLEIAWRGYSVVGAQPAKIATRSRAA